MADFKGFSEGMPLGKETEYSFSYDSGLLFPIKRQLGRDKISVSATALPFEGIDRWTAFELSYLTETGQPKVAIAQFDFDASSENIIESKSFKLYLNSFNQTVVPDQAWLKRCLEKDLAKAANGRVEVQLFTVDNYPIEEPGNYIDLDQQCIHCVEYSPNANLLSLSDNEETTDFAFKSHLLRSLCPVTGQPDWASLYIKYRGPSICTESLLRYIVSFRNHQGFHEQCVEQIFCDLKHLLSPQSLMVYARYMRRGGLDINPFRMMGNDKYNQKTLIAVRTARQ